MASSSHIRQIFVTGRASKSIELPISLYHGSLGKIADTRALLDSGATGNFIDHDFVARNHWPKERLPSPILAHNADGSPNQKGMIRFRTQLTLRIGDKEET